tara:strand:+ start:379 stop:630 length:252 start_codon:yes stop_codon:yes gene_type:complete
MAKSRGGLTKWFKEEWVDLRTGKQCGRSGEEMSTRKYPVCRPKAVANRMSAAQKRSVIAKKKGPKPIKYPITASGKKRLQIKK